MTDIVENLTTKTENLEINPKFDKWNDLPQEVKSEYLKSMEAEKSSQTSDNIVKLNIGGTFFQTSKSTLKKFDRFFNETDIPLEKDETGTIFIDRSPKHFDLILNYMRDGFVNMPESKSDVQEIQVEAKCYLLDGLVKECGEKVSTFEKGKVTHARTAQELALALTHSESKALIMIPLKTDGSAEDVIRATVPIAKIGNKFDVVYYDYNKSKNPSVKIRTPNTGDIKESTPESLVQDLKKMNLI